jgi:hypothetical protein
MTTRSNGPAVGFGWLAKAVGVSFRHPKPLYGAAAIMVLVCLLPSLITLPMQLHAISTGTPLSPAAFCGMMAASMVFGLLLVPLYAGYLQLVDAAERELPARARDVFKPYRQGEAWRLIGYGLALLLVYVVVLGIIIVATGGGIASWYMQVLAAQASHQVPPALPPGFGIAMALLTVFGLFMMGFYAISLGQIALNHRSVFEALGDGVIGALKNLLPLLVFAVSVAMAWLAFVVVLVVAAILLALLGKLIGMWLVFVLIIPLYIAMVLVLFAVLFGSMYYLWRDVCGSATATAMPPPLAA